MNQKTELKGFYEPKKRLNMNISVKRKGFNKSDDKIEKIKIK